VCVCRPRTRGARPGRAPRDTPLLRRREPTQGEEHRHLRVSSRRAEGGSGPVPWSRPARAHDPGPRRPGSRVKSLPPGFLSDRPARRGALRERGTRRQRRTAHADVAKRHVPRVAAARRSPFDCGPRAPCACRATATARLVADPVDERACLRGRGAGVGPPRRGGDRREPARGSRLLARRTRDECSGRSHDVHRQLRRAAVCARPQRRDGWKATDETRRTSRSIRSNVSVKTASSPPTRSASGTGGNEPRSRASWTILTIRSAG